MGNASTAYTAAPGPGRAIRHPSNADGPAASSPQPGRDGTGPGHGGTGETRRVAAIPRRLGPARTRPRARTGLKNRLSLHRVRPFRLRVCLSFRLPCPPVLARRPRAARRGRTATDGEPRRRRLPVWAWAIRGEGRARPGPVGLRRRRRRRRRRPDGGASGARQRSSWPSTACPGPRPPYVSPAQDGGASPDGVVATPNWTSTTRRHGAMAPHRAEWRRKCASQFIPRSGSLVTR